jgi:hypothetical protein
MVVKEGFRNIVYFYGELPIITQTITFMIGVSLEKVIRAHLLSFLRKTLSLSYTSLLIIRVFCIVLLPDAV